MHFLWVQVYSDGLHVHLVGQFLITKFMRIEVPFLELSNDILDYV